MGLAWVNQCFCANSYNNGNGNNGNQADCPGGECPITDCDSTGTIADPPVGVADLCTNGEGNCGNRLAVYSLKAATIRRAGLDAPVIQLDQLDGVIAILDTGVGAGGSVCTATDEEVDEIADASVCAELIVGTVGCGWGGQGYTASEQAPLLIDNNYESANANWEASPHGQANDCSTRFYATVDLGRIRLVSGVTVWHFYGDGK